MTMIKVSEVFGPTVQGEGPLIGQPTLFVRTGGCDYRCSWCDTPFAVDVVYKDQWTAMASNDIVAKLSELSEAKGMLVTLSGGNPALQPCEALIVQGKAQGFRFAMETQGSVSQSWFTQLETLVLSPKPPSSGMATDLKKLDACIEFSTSINVYLKMVVFDKNDLSYAKSIAERYSHIKCYLQPGNPEVDSSQSLTMDTLKQRYLTLLDWVTEAEWADVTVLPQWHVFLWGNERAC